LPVQDPPSASVPADKDLFHTGSVLCVTMDDNIMISGSSDSSCIIWELPKFRPIKRVFRHALGVLDIDMDKKHVVSCSKDSTISVWERDCKYSLKCRLSGHRGPINALQISGDLIVSAGGDALVKLWSVREEKCIRSFKGHTRGLACVQISSCQKYVVSGGNDNTIRIWNTETGECLHRLDGHKSLIRSICISSGRIISGSYDQTIKVWDLETGELISDLAGMHGSWIFSARASIQRIVSTSFGTKPVILDFSIGLDRTVLQHITG
jgi:F-box and WD-40 domain protein 1/11